MAVITINPTMSNPSLAALAARMYEKDWTNVPNNCLPTELVDELKVVYKALTGNDFPIDNGNTLRVKASNGELDRLYSPVFQRNEAQSTGIEIRWGQDEIAVELDDDKFSIPSATDVTLKPGKFNFSGRGDDKCVFIQTRHNGDTYRFPVVVRDADWQNDRVDIDEFIVLFEDDPSELLPRISARSTGAGTGSGKGSSPERVFGQNMLPIGEYVITRALSRKNGNTFILCTDHNGEEIGIWAPNKSLGSLRAHGDKINQDNPVVLTISDYVNKDGETKHKSFLDMQQLLGTVNNESGLKLDF